MGAENKYDLKLSPSYNASGNPSTRNELSMCRKLSSTSSSSLNSNGTQPEATPTSTSSFQLSPIVPAPTTAAARTSLSTSKCSAVTTTTDSSAAKGGQMSSCSIYSNRKCSSTSSLVSDQQQLAASGRLAVASGKQASSTDNLKETEKKTLTRAKGDISLVSESDRENACGGGFSNVALSPTQEEENEDELMDKVETSSHQSNESGDKCTTINLSGKVDGPLIGLKSDFTANGLLATSNNNNELMANNNHSESTKNDEDEQAENKENAMSVSVPNLSLNGGDVSAMMNETETTAASLMEAFSSLSRRSSSNNNSNSLNNYNNSFNSSNNQLCNSLVRLALAANFPDLIAELLNELAGTENCSDILANQQLLSTAQSYPSLSTNDANSTTTMTLSEARRNFNPQPVSGNSSGFTLSTSSELFENCTTSLLSGIEDELDANDENDDELDEENEDYDYVSLMDESSYDLQKNKRKNCWDDDFVLKRSSAG